MGSHRLNVSRYSEGLQKLQEDDLHSSANTQMLWESPNHGNTVPIAYELAAT